MFLSNNEVWKALNISNEEAFDFMVAKCKELISWEEELKHNGIIANDVFLSLVYLNANDEIIAVIANCDLTQHINKVSQVKCDKFNALKTYGR